MAVNKGAAALEVLDAMETAAKSESAKFTKLKSGTTLKVKVKGVTDFASFYNYGSYDRGVYSFTPVEPAQRNAKGFISGGETPWDLAANYYQALANAEADKAKQDELKAEARVYRGELRFMVGFHDLESGEDIVIDFSKNQFGVIHTAIKKYAKKLDKVAFELSKSGSGTSTTVSLSPVLDMDEDITEKERAVFAKAEGQAFNDSLFDSLVYEADHAEQVANLVKAGFDVSLIGPAPATDEAPPITDAEGPDEDPTAKF